MSTLVEVVVTLVWACLQVPGAQNYLFAQLFFALEVVSDIAAVTSLTFCPGLQEVLNAPSPPDVSWFKSLPANHLGRWGVYVLVFKQPEHKPHLYCGSATEVGRGISSRWALYDRHNLYLRDNVDGLPSGVLKAFRAGFKITHKGLLVTAPIASAANVPTYRLLFYALEATFSFMFWMMHSNKYLLYHACTRWPVDSFKYKGLCSHSALRDPIAGCFDLSADQLIALANDAAKRKAAYNKVYHRSYRAAHPEDIRANHARSEASIWASGKYRCNTCGTRCKSEWEVVRHNRSRGHIIRAEKVRMNIDRPFKCHTCGYATEVKDSLRRHKDGELHKRRMRLAGMPAPPYSSS